jgi:hypothetical protein
MVPANGNNKNAGTVMANISKIVRIGCANAGNACVKTKTTDRQIGHNPGSCARHAGRMRMIAVGTAHPACKKDR